ncbi:MAG: penicillin-binding protein, partial [Acidimicrobiaceae bacterium]|nr:penicillin-binding protein [Acidimicrobiaceae bacterium]
QQVATQYPEFVDYVYRYLVAKYGPNAVLRGGMDVTVTLDPNLQNMAKASVTDALNGTNPELQMSLVSIEPQTGYVKALVGGREFGNGKYSSVNFALGGCVPKPTNPAIKIEVSATCWDGGSLDGGGGDRQPGSAFKPFTLATAFSKGFTPAKAYPAPDTYAPPGCKKPDCLIHNAADGEGGGSMDLRVATTKSVNTVFAQLIRDVGVKETADMAKRLGVTSAWESPQVHGLSYTLGALGVAPLDMASAYGVFANRGVRANPQPVLLVKDSSGKVLEDNSHPQTNRVLEENVADTLNDVLRGPVGPGGTAYPRADIGRPAAGKTGTTDNYVDAWFVGYTPTLSTSVWMGYAANETTSMRNVKGVRDVFGGTIPAQTWHNFMLPALKDVPVTDFTQPAPIKPLVVDVNKQARQGIDPGDRSVARDTPPGGAYVVAPPAPSAVAPTTTTTAPPDSGGFGNGSGDGSGGNGGGSDQTTTTSSPRTTLVPPRP